MELRLIKQDDIEQLRLWKNKNKSVFFHKEDITEEQQKLWYEDHKKRTDDYMCVLSENNKNIGCIGIRKLFDRWDIYNVMIEDEYRNNGKMLEALKSMIHLAACRSDMPITAKVIKSNPTLGWYLKNGFIKSSDNESYCTIEYVGNTRLYE